MLDRVDGHHVPRGLDVTVRLDLASSSTAEIREENFRLPFQVGAERVCELPADALETEYLPVLRLELEGPYAVAQEHHDEGVDVGERRVLPNSVYLLHRLLRAEVWPQDDLVAHGLEGRPQVLRVMFGSVALLSLTWNGTHSALYVCVYVVALTLLPQKSNVRASFTFRALD